MAKLWRVHEPILNRVIGLLSHPAFIHLYSEWVKDLFGAVEWWTDLRINCANVEREGHSMHADAGGLIASNLWETSLIGQ